MKKIISLVLALIIAILSLSFLINAIDMKTLGNVMPFNDVESGEYYYLPIQWAFDSSITSGTSDITFEPNNTCTRAQVVTFLWRAEGMPKPSIEVNPFVDVKSNEYYYNAILWAVENEITLGTDFDKFSPDDIVTRSQFVTFLWRVAGKPNSQLLSEFSDVIYTKSDYYYTAVMWAVSNEITKGVSDDLFEVDGCCTRGQAVTFMYRYYTGDRKTNKSEGFPVKSLKIDGLDISNYSIYFDNESPEMINAANETQKYIKNATGVELTIYEGSPSKGTKRIYLKNTNVNGNIDCYKYYSDDDGIVIEGSASRGILYGAYNFIEDEIGWRFLSKDFEACLESDAIDLTDLLVEYTPYFYYRDASGADGFDDTFCAKRQINARMVSGSNYRENDWGDILTYSFNGPHTMGELTETGGWMGDGDIYCLNEEKTYQTVLKNVKALLEIDPNAQLIDVSQTDGYQRCNCDACKQDEEYYQGYAGIYVEFINRLLEELNVDYPNLKIEMYAYNYTRNCPVNIVANKNLVARFCCTDICYNHAFSDSTCEINAEFDKQYQAWRELLDEQVYIYDYSISYACYSYEVPNIYVLRENVKYFYDNGCTHYLNLVNWNDDSPEFSSLKTYLIMLCMENPNISAEEYQQKMEEFMYLYYGEGYEYILKYIYLIEELADNLGNHFDTYMTPEVKYGEHAFTQYNEDIIKWWDKAEELAGSDEQLHNIKLSRLHADFLRIGSIYKQYYKGTSEQKQYIKDQSTKLCNAYFDLGQDHMGEATILVIDPVCKNIARNPRQWVTYYEYKD